MNTHRYSPAVVDHGHAVVIVDDDINLAAVTRHGLIDAVVHDLVNQVVQSGNVNVSNIHGRPFTDRFQAFENLDVVFCIIVVFCF